MDYRGLLAFVWALGAATLAMVACSAPDPGELTFAERRAIGASGDVGSSGTSSGGSSGGSSSGTSGATSSGGTDGGGGGNDPVFGASAFAPGNPPQNANGASAQHAGSVEGKDCMQGACHGAGGAGPTWAFGGTLKTAATNGQPVAGAEVRVTAPNGTEYGKAYTDANGNFWFEKVAGDIPANSRVGVRNAAKVSLMAGIVGGANSACNSTTCHGTGSTQGAVYLTP